MMPGSRTLGGGGFGSDPCVTAAFSMLQRRRDSIIVNVEILFRYLVPER